MKIKFWGVRGSIPCPGPDTMKYGGNTSCIELRFENPERLIIIDAGSGIRQLGDYIMANDLPKGPIRTEIFLTHTHWDHILGFPFFTPIYIPDTKLKVYGPSTFEEDSLADVIGGQLVYRYFPVRQAELASNIEYLDLKEDRLDLGDGITVVTKYLNHPVSCLGYRFESKDKAFCTVFDTEPFRNVFCVDPDDPSYDEAMASEGEQVAAEQNQRIEEFMKNADFIVHDTQYTRKEYESSRLGWGHSTFEQAIAMAKRAGVKRMAFFHHDPVRTDAQIDELTRKYCDSVYTGDMEVFFARESAEIEI
jgi:phosphoribosyl 1,2-cyclic phosphodiesterase